MHRRLVMTAAVAALSCAGDAHAAATIDGKRIKPGTITAKQIKNGTITSKELGPDAVGVDNLDSKLAGLLESIFVKVNTAPPAGPVGPAGPAGPAGKDAPAYSAGDGLKLDQLVLSIDEVKVQRRVTGACPAGQSIRAIAVTGTVTCEADDTGAGTGGSPSGPAGGDLTGTFPNPTIKSDAVTAAHIAAAAVGLSELASSSVDAARVVDNSLTALDLATNAVGYLELQSDAVRSENVLDSTLTAADLGVDSVGYPEIAAGAVRPDSMAVGAAAANAFASSAPSGSTQRGLISFGGDASSERAAISFPVALAVAPTTTILSPGQTTAACSGTHTDPTAAPGNLCVYLQVESNVGSRAAQPAKFGAGLVASPAGAGVMSLMGTWAVTAP